MPTIKLIATDMDGTFLNSNKDYDRKRFNRIFQQLQAQDITFVVASGNQVAQLQSFFPEDIRSNIIFAGDNGGVIYHGEEFIDAAHINHDTLTALINYVETNYPHVPIVLSGVNNGYIRTDNSDAYKENIAHYFHKLIEVDDLQTFQEDHYVKLTLETPSELCRNLIAELNKQFGDQLNAVITNGDNIDINPIDSNKGVAIQNIAQKRNISPDEILAFGDSGNDLEMIQYATHGYAMTNAYQDLKNITHLIAPSNDNNGVLEIVEEYINKI